MTNEQKEYLVSIVPEDITPTLERLEQIKHEAQLEVEEENHQKLMEKRK
jgi:hypothetical protein